MIAAFAAPFVRWGAAAAVVGMLSAWALLENGWRHSAETRATAAEAAVRGRDKAIVEMQRIADAAAARTTRNHATRRSVDAAPSTRACVDSPAVRALLDGLRTAAPAVGDPVRHGVVPGRTPAAGGAR